MGKSKDLATGASYVDTSGDTMTGTLVAGTRLQVGDSSITQAYPEASNGYIADFQASTGSQTFVSIAEPSASSLGDNGLILGEDTGASYLYQRQSKPINFGTNNTTRMTIDGSGRVTKPSQPSFNAYRNTSLTTNTGSSHTLVPDYTGTRFNQGSHFNTSNGRFTAPVAGEYLFGVNNNMGSLHTVKSWRLYINGSAWIILSYADVSASWQNLSATTIVTLNANDYIQFGYRGQPDYGNDWLNVYGYLMG